MWIAYLKIALKVLMRRKFFTFISLFGISFTLMVLITAAAIFENLYVPRAPESDADRLLNLYRLRYHNPERQASWTSNPGYKFLRTHVPELPHVETYSVHSEPEPVLSFRDGVKHEFHRKRTDGEFWRIFDYTFLEGAPYSAEDEANRNFVAVISRATRDQYFGTSGVIGEEIQLDGQTFRVVGVVNNVPDYRFLVYGDVYVPISTSKTDTYRENTMGSFNGSILAKSKDDLTAIQDIWYERLKTIQTPRPDELQETHAPMDTYFQTAIRESDDWRQWYRDPGTGQFLTRVAIAVVLFLLLPVINTVNINVSRIMERSSEIGVRKAFGATSRQLARQFLVENLVLTGFGGVCGLFLAWLATRAINSMTFYTHADLRLQSGVAVVALLATLVFGVASGVYPAWRMSKTNPANALKGGLR